MTTYYDRVSMPALRSALHAFETDADFRSRALRNSYRHTNGFLKISLGYRAESRIELRLHVWLPSGADSDVHSHTAGIRSTVISGAIQEDIFQEGDGNAKLQKLKYSSRNLGGDGSFLDCGDHQIQRVETRIHRAGETYEIQPHTIHRVVNPFDLNAITFIEKFPAKSRTSYVFRSKPSHDRTFEEQVSSELVSSYLADAAAAVSLLS